VPIGKKNDLAIHLANVDSIYRQLFFVPEWKNAFEKQEELNNEEVKEVQKRFTQYVSEATYNFPFQIGEALLTVHNPKTNKSEQKTVPFIKGVQIGVKEFEATTSELPSELQLDYWVQKKKGESKKEIKSFQFVALTRFPTVASGFNIEPENLPTNSAFSLFVQFRDKTNKVKEAITHIGSKIKDKKKRRH